MYFKNYKKKPGAFDRGHRLTINNEAIFFINWVTTTTAYHVSWIDEVCNGIEGSR